MMKRPYLLCATLLLISMHVFAQSAENIAYLEHNDLQYLDEKLVKNDTAQRLNLILPKEKKDVPLLVWVGGGAWSYGNRDMETNLARQFAKEGIAMASVGHRLSSALWRSPKDNGGAQHPDHIEDLAAAFKWLYDRADKYGYDQNKIFVGGFSSGAHLAALLALDEKYLKAYGLSKENIKGIIPISGTYDIPDYHEVFKNGNNPDLAIQHVESVFGNTQAQMLDASPTTYLENLSTPILLMADNNVQRYTHFFEDRLLETSFRDFEVIYVYNLSHGDLWREIAQAESTYRSIIKGFIESQISS